MMLLSAMVVATDPTIGVCWTRNRIPLSQPDAALLPLLRPLAEAALSLRAADPAVQRCVFTETPAARLETLMHQALGPHGLFERTVFFDLVLPDRPVVPRAAAHADALRTAQRVQALLAGARPSRPRVASHVLRSISRFVAGDFSLLLSRMGRIANMLTPPFDVTLYLDDDTHICPRATGPPRDPDPSSPLSVSPSLRLRSSSHHVCLTGLPPLAAWARALFGPRTRADVRMVNLHATRGRAPLPAEVP